MERSCFTCLLARPSSLLPFLHSMQAVLIIWYYHHYHSVQIAFTITQPPILPPRLWRTFSLYIHRSIIVNLFSCVIQICFSYVTNTIRWKHFKIYGRLWNEMRSIKLLPSTNFSRLKKWYKISEISNVKTIIKNNSHTQCYSPLQPRMYLYAKRRNDSIFAYFHLFDINSAWFVIQNLKNFPKRIVIAFSIFLFGAQCTFPLSSPPPRVRFHFQFYLFAILSVNIENNFTINWKQFRSICVYSSTIQSRMPKKRHK